MSHGKIESGDSKNSAGESGGTTICGIAAGFAKIGNISILYTVTVYKQ